MHHAASGSFSRRPALGLVLALGLGGCMLEERAAAHHAFDAWLERAVAIEQAATATGRIDGTEVTRLCGELASGMTPQRWLGLAADVGGPYSQEPEAWVALSTWQQLRCTSPTATGPGRAQAAADGL